MRRFISFRTLFLFLFVIGLVAKLVSGADFSSWNRKMKVTFAGYSQTETLTNFPALIVLNTNRPGFRYSDFASPDGGDLRFSDASQTNELNYEIETWDTNGDSFVWVQVPRLEGTNTSIYAFWGKAGATAPPYTTNGATWSDGFLGVWHLSPSLVDSTARGADGYTNGIASATDATGKIGRARSFNMSAVGLPNNSVFTTITNFTASAWVKPVTVSGWDSIFAANNDDFIFCLENGCVELWTGGGYTGTQALSPGNWALIHFVRTGTSWRTYINGVVDKPDGTGCTTPNTPGAPRAIGRDLPNSGSEGFDGIIDELRIEGVGRSSNWIWACWMNTASNEAFCAFSGEAPQPQVLNATATNVTPISASLNGFLVSTGQSATTVAVFWGTNDAGTAQAGWGQTNWFIGTRVPGPHSTNVALTANRLYFYRYYATNAHGESWADPASVLISGAVTLTAPDPVAGEDGPDTATFRVSRPAGTTGAALLINYAVSGTASNGVDYVPLTGSVTIPAGAVEADIVIDPIPDANTNEGSETVILTLLPGPYVIGSPFSATGTIVDGTGPLIHYVSPSGEHIWPFTSWATAARNVQAAVDAAEDGRVVMITDGVYRISQRIMIAKAITVTSVNGPNATIIDAQGEDEGCIGIRHPNAIVERLALTGGGFDNGGGAHLTAGLLRDCWVYTNYSYSGGGGVYLQGGGIVSNCVIWWNGTSGDGGGVLCDGGGEVINSIIFDNQAAYDGGGIECRNGGVVRGCLIRNNAARFGGGVAIDGGGMLEDSNIISNSNEGVWGTGAAGGGVYVEKGIVRRCLVAHNLLTNTSARGGGLYMDGDTLVENCVISNNTVTASSAAGGGVVIKNSSNLLVNSVIVGNKAITSDGYGGGGLYFFADDSYARNCLIADNIVTSQTLFAWVYGGGVLFYGGGAVQNCTVVSNEAFGMSGGAGIYHRSGGLVENCVVQFNYDDGTLNNHQNTSNGVWRYSCTTSLVAGVGNTDADPLFADPAARNYRLTDDSPCVNKGNNDPWMNGAVDLDGNPRIRTGVVDMGAYEHNPTVFQCAFVGEPRFGWDQVTAIFTSYVGGPNTNVTYYGWDFNGDGVPESQGANLRVVTNTYGPGIYSVRLVVSNTVGETAFYAQTNYIVVYPSVVYVAPGGASIFPYATWATAATNPALVGSAIRDGVTVLVSNGTYFLTSEVVITNSVLFRSLNGPTATIFNGNGAVRVFNLAHTSAVVSGFTITNGVAEVGGGVYIAAGRVENCIITGNRATWNWGGAAGGGVRMTGGILRNCLVVGNQAPGGGAQGGGITAASSALIENCTVVRNSAYSNAGGIQGGTVVNSIVLLNTAVFDPNYLGMNATYTCTTPHPGGTGNFTNDPQFVAADNYRLSVNSPCRDFGRTTNWMASATDLDGNPRIFNSIVDIGCYEYRSTALVCSFLGTPNAGRQPLTVAFTSYVDGANTNITWYGWDFDGDGLVDRAGAGVTAPTNTYTAAQYFTVRLTVSNTAGETASCTRSDYIRVESTNFHVALGGSHTPPFSSWATAATNIQAAINIASTGSTILVSNGTYLVTTTIRITNNVTLKSLNGPAVTVIDGGNAVLCLRIDHSNAVVDGFTIMRGKADALYSSQGAGVNMNGGVLQNCIIRSNTACSGSASFGGGIFAYNKAVIRNCLIERNSVTCGNAQGGGVCGANLLLENCTIVGNHAVYGGGVYFYSGVTGRNCIIYGNTASVGPTNWEGGVYRHTCTVPLPSGAGNTDQDPMFVDVGAQDYRLQTGSPCVDTGTNAPLVTADLVGVPRPLDGNNDGVARWDMGCYELVHPLADTDSDGLRDTNELAIGTSLLRPDSDNDRMSDGDEVRAGSDPLNAASFLGLMNAWRQGLGLVVEWQSATGKTYRLTRCTNVPEGVWAPVFTNVPAVPPMNAATDTTAVGNGPWSYRIELE